MRRANYAHILGYTVLTLVLTAGAAQSLAGSNTVGSDDIATGAVTTSDIRDSAVTSPKIRQGAVYGGDIHDGAVAQADLAAAVKNRQPIALQFTPAQPGLGEVFIHSSEITGRSFGDTSGDYRFTTNRNLTRCAAAVTPTQIDHYAVVGLFPSSSSIRVLTWTLDGSGNVAFDDSGVHVVVNCWG